MNYVRQVEGPVSCSLHECLRWFAVVAVVLPASDALAQTPLPPERPPEAVRPEQPALNAAEQGRLERLAELLGTLSILRDLCPPNDGAAWRGKMEELLAAQATVPQSHERLAGAFNRGFDSYRYAYRRCTGSAELAIERAMGEGARLARELSTRFGE